MHFTYFEARNAGPFDDLKLELQHGSVGIFGRNGRGKSTILNCMYALVTNDFGRFDGLKVDCIKNTAGPKTESYVYGRIEHGGHKLSIRRGLYPARSSLAVDDGKEITDSNKIQEEIDSVLGVERKLLDLYVFKTQDRIYDFLATTSAERAKAFAILCRTERCEEAWDFLGTFLNKDQEVNAVITDDSDELAQAVSSLQERVSELESQVKAEEEVLLNAKSEASAREILRRADRLEDLTAQREGLDDRVKVLLETLSGWQSKVNKRQKRVEDWEAYVDGMRPEAEDARAALRAWDSYKKYRQRRRQLKDEADALAQEEKQHPAPEFPEELDGVAQLAELNKCLVACENQLKKARAVVATFAATGMAACPTCDTPVAHLKDHLEEQKRLVADLPKDIKAVENQVELWENYNAYVRKYEKWRAGYDARVRANQEAREAIKDIKAPDGDEKALQKAVTEFEASTQELNDARSALRKARDGLAETDATIKSLNLRRNEVIQSIAENTDPAEKVQRARQRLDEHLAADKNIARIQGEIKGLNDQVADKQAELKKLRARLKRSKRVRRAAGIVSMARDVLHRDRLPRRVARVNLARMEGDINAGLEDFGSPFWVDGDENLSFVAHKPGEPPQPAARLSTGQRVVLALSFWPAVASLWESDLGMLALDEPTANLDEENRKFLAQALGALTAKVRGRRQLIMVTHDQNLRTAFDQVIDLGG